MLVRTGIHKMLQSVTRLTAELRREISNTFHFLFSNKMLVRAGINKLLQLVTHLTADPRVASFIPTRSHTFMEIDH